MKHHLLGGGDDDVHKPPPDQIDGPRPDLIWTNRRAEEHGEKRSELRFGVIKSLIKRRRREDSIVSRTEKLVDRCGDGW